MTSAAPPHGVWSHDPNVTEADRCADRCPDCQKVGPLVTLTQAQYGSLRSAASADSTGLRAALDNLLRHHNSGSDHVPSTNPYLPDCAFARQALDALAPGSKSRKDTDR